MQVLQERHWMQSWSKLQVVSLLGGHRGQRTVDAGSVAGKDHRKTECKVKGNGNNYKPSSNDSGLGGGRGGGNQNAAAANNKAAVKQASVGKGHDGGIASSTTDQTSSSTCADGPGLGAESNSLGASSSATTEVDKGGAPAATPATTDLLAEATQLLKSLAYAQPEGNATVKVWSLMLKWCCWTLVQHMAYVLQLQKKNGSRAQELR